MTNIKVAVRVRPFNQREKDMGSECIIRMDSNQTHIKDPVSHLTKHKHKSCLQETGEEKTYSFDKCFWSHDGFVEPTEAGGYMGP